MQTSLFLFLGDIGGSELMLIMVVILVFFGANKIPELARGLGKGIREFKDASSEIRREFEQSGQPAPPNYSQQQPNYGTQPSYPAPLPAPGAEVTPGSGYDHPGAAPVAVGLPVADQPLEHHTPAPAAPIAPALPPNLAPEGTQPRQPYIPATPDA
ncbi:MAG: hypothetical protein NVS3B25_13160 [Hymenobacter sp.]